MVSVLTEVSLLLWDQKFQSIIKICKEAVSQYKTFVNLNYGIVIHVLVFSVLHVNEIFKKTNM